MVKPQGELGGADRAYPWRLWRARFAGGNRYHFDRFGAHLGHLDAVGRYFDKQGILRGSLSQTGAFHDECGAYMGRVDAIGQYWNAHGIAHGYFLGAGPHQHVPPGAAEVTAVVPANAAITFAGPTATHSILCTYCGIEFDVYGVAWCEHVGIEPSKSCSWPRRCLCDDAAWGEPIS